jgi:hypothetical protein
MRDNIRMDIKEGRIVWTGFIWFKMGTTDGSGEHGN